MNELTIPWQPWAKKRPRISKSVAGRNARTHQSRDDRDAEDRTRTYIAKNWTDPPIRDNVSLSVVFYRRTRQIVDLDNLLKHLMDAANGILWINDYQVTEIYARMELDADRPRTNFTVTGRPTTMIRSVPANTD